MQNPPKFKGIKFIPPAASPVPTRQDIILSVKKENVGLVLDSRGFLGARDY
jgi:hypothetical protein